MYDVVVIGGGIVGLASALNTLEANPSIRLAVLEKEKGLCQHQTGHNSGVIHSGIYYPPGSLKARNCLEGYRKLLDFCDRESIPYELCGKVIVATSKAELPHLEKIFKRGQENGLENLKKLTTEELKDYEPYVNGIAGIHVPQTGIIDYREVAAGYTRRLRALGAEIYLNEKVVDIHTRHNSEITTVRNRYHTRLVINCGGLYSDKLASMSKDIDLRIVPFRGEYYELKPERRHLVRNLIYPVPDPNFPFLGVHFTRMINGGVEAGPNAVLAFKREGYKKTSFNPQELMETLTWPGFQKVAFKYWRTGMGEFVRSFSKSAFTKALQRLLPEIREEDLMPGGSGVRAQACSRTGGLLDDFAVYEDAHAIHVCNAPSPAATSSLAIGSHVASLATSRLKG